MVARQRSNGHAAVRAWDVALVVWTLAVCGLAIWTGAEVHRLTDISDTLASSSRALETTATGLDRVGNVPFVGPQISEVVDRLRDTAASARANAASTRGTIDRIAILIAVAIVTIAVVPPVVAYLAIRPSLRRGRAR